MTYVSAKTVNFEEHDDFILSTSVFKTYWFSWSNSILSGGVGGTVGGSPMATWTDLNPGTYILNRLTIKEDYNKGPLSFKFHHCKYSGRWVHKPRLSHQSLV